VQSTTPDLKTRKGGYIEADPETLKTSKVGVFGAGDIVTGAATVILSPRMRSEVSRRITA
jgi:glutamate synthase (NADPH/NADH) small chain